jgi:L-alanine-DL-glutamate epimerase-like enolase superfamily enzyme
MIRDPFTIDRIDAAVYRAPLDRPVATAFGIMRDRPALLVKVSDADGAHGWGEVWCNWPASAAEHRARLVTEDLAELVLGRAFSDAPACFEHMSERVVIKTLQSGEPGPYAQAIAGLDMALWDLAARRASKPLHALLAPGSTDRVRTYASGIDIRAAERVMAESRAAGHHDFKVKVGFGLEDEAARVASLAATLRQGEGLAIDANQGFGLSQALAFVAALENVPLQWLEEPLRVDAPDEDWRTLAARATMPLAGGENFSGRAMFDTAIRGRCLDVVQPDAAKWGGVTGCFAVAQATLTAGLRYCPHFLGSGIGLAASAQILAAAGGDGLLEIDSNPNPLRTEIFAEWPMVANGVAALPDAPGLCIEPELKGIARFRTLKASAIR